jgi:hypothetical protein
MMGLLHSLKKGHAAVETPRGPGTHFNAAKIDQEKMCGAPPS